MIISTPMHKCPTLILNKFKLKTLPKKKSNLHLSYDINNYQHLLSHIQESDDTRWILFIAPPGKPKLSFFQQAGIAKSRIITLTQKQISDTHTLLNTVLSNNNYAIVITWLNNCNKNDQSILNQLTQQSNTQCFVYCAQ